MPDFTVGTDQTHHPVHFFLKLLAAWFLGSAVAWVYGKIRHREELSASFATTLVMLSVLIAMVTQVIGDNVARAFSLVGALSIVRFRTVVRDTQDTAFVIFAVVLGMACGAENYWVAGLGLLIGSVAVFVRRTNAGPLQQGDDTFLLKFRVGLGQEVEAVFTPELAGLVEQRKLLSVQTAKQGSLLDVTYRVAMRAKNQPDLLVKLLNRTEGVQNVEMVRESAEAI
jgi:uncharacterized membrane protein YhiD involved in acid resistance